MTAFAILIAAILAYLVIDKKFIAPRVPKCKECGRRYY